MAVRAGGRVRRSEQRWDVGPIRNMASNVWRRWDWFLRDAAPGQVVNLIRAGASFAAGNERLRAAPVLLKVDISPVCNLRCTYCVHARSEDMGDDAVLGAQAFSGAQRMSVDQLGRIVDEVAGATSAIR